jgi:predicted nucleic-acid-binding Zn-ribbon protein
MVKIVFGMMEMTYEEEGPVFCADEKCIRYIGTGAKCFVDTWAKEESKTVYCENCGPCERYHRKKANQRGELVRPV